MLHFFLQSRAKHFKLINSTVYVTVPCRNQMFEHNAAYTVLLNFHKWWGSYVLHRCMNIYEAFMSPALLFKKKAARSQSSGDAFLFVKCGSNSCKFSYNYCKMMPFITELKLLDICVLAFTLGIMYLLISCNY